MTFDVNTITVHNAPMRWVRQAVAFYNKFGEDEDPALHFKSDFVFVYPKLIEVATLMGLIGAQTNPTVATPTFTPVDGNITADHVQVTISCATSGATIRYTTNGSDPTSSSPVYSTPLELVAEDTDPETITVKAVASHYGQTTSAVASKDYTLNYV